MAITLDFHGIKVTCDKPEEAMILAGTAASMKAPKASDLAKITERPITIVVNGVQMTCENPASAAAALVAAGIVTRPKKYTSESRGAQGSGPSRAWAVAEEYGKKHGITTDEARRLIKKKKDEIQARLSVNQSLTKDDMEFQARMREIEPGDEPAKKAPKKK